MLLDTIEGQAPFDVVAIAEMSNLPAEIAVGREAGAAMGAWGTDGVLVRAADGVEPEVLRDRIEVDLGDRAQFLVVTADEYRADTRAQIGGGINSFFVLLALAAVVGTFGCSCPSNRGRARRTFVQSVKPSPHHRSFSGIRWYCGR